MATEILHDVNPETQAKSRIENLLYLRSRVSLLVEESERLLGVAEGFCVTVELARVYDEINREIQKCSGYSEVLQ